MITYIFVMRIVMTKHSRIEGFPSTRTWDAPPPRETIGRPSMPKATSDEFVRGANRSRGDRGESLSFAPKNGKSWQIMENKLLKKGSGSLKSDKSWKRLVLLDSPLFLSSQMSGWKSVREPNDLVLIASRISCGFISKGEDQTNPRWSASEWSRNRVPSDVPSLTLGSSFCFRDFPLKQQTSCSTGKKCRMGPQK